MARSVAPETMEPAFSDTHTLSHAPQPLHLSSITVGLNESFNPYKADLAASDLDIKRVG